MTPSDPAPRELVLRGARCSYTDEGPSSGPALVAIHGIPGSGRDFRHLAPRLAARGMRVLRLDLPGFGGSELEREALATLDGRIALVGALVDALGLPHYAVLGHSMGGATALLAAAARPARVSLLVLVASVGLRRHRGLGLPPGGFAYLARALEQPLVAPLLVALSRLQYRRRQLPGSESLDAADFALQLRAIAALDFERLRRAVAGPMPETLLAYARDDHLVEPAIAEELVRTLPRARALSFADGGHNLQKTRAEQLADAIAARLVRARVGEPTPRGARLADATRPRARAGAAEA